MALDVSNVVNVTINVAPKAVPVRGFGQMLIIGTSDVIPEKEKIRYYSNLNDVGADFPTSSKEYQCAALYFAQSPSPNDVAIGRWNNQQLGTKTVVEGAEILNLNAAKIDDTFTIKVNNVDTAISANLTKANTLAQMCAILNEKFILSGTGTPAIPEVQEVQNEIQGLGTVDFDTTTWSALNTAGAIKISYADNSEVESIETQEFDVISDGDELVAALSAALTGHNLTFTVDDDKLTIRNNDHTKDMTGITINATGVSVSNLGLNSPKVTAYVPYQAPQDPVPAVYFATADVGDNNNILINPIDTTITLDVPTGNLANVLKLSSATGGVLLNESILQESAVDVVNNLADLSQTWYSMAFAATLTDKQTIDVAKLVEALSPVRMFGVTLTSPDELSPVVSNSLGKLLKKANLKRTVMQYSSSSPYAVASYIGRVVTTDYTANNTVITLMFKQEPSVQSEELSTTQAKTLASNNINVFAAYSNDTAIIQHGTQADGTWTDELIGLDWLQNYVQTAVYNLFYTNTTKIPQTNQGMNMIVSCVNKALNQALANGLLAARTWNGPAVGSLATGAYLGNGYFTYAPNVENQAQADREARKAPAIQVACTLSGAFHSADVIINVMR